MKTTYDKIYLTLMLQISLIVLITLDSCHDEVDSGLTPSVIQFTTSSKSATEGSEILIVLTLDKPAAEDGSVIIMMETNAIYNQHFFTDPEPTDNMFALAISKGQTSAQFKVTAIDNTLYEKARILKFTLSNPSNGLKIGLSHSLSLTVYDDEGPSVAKFQTNAGTVNEDEATGITIQILFSTLANGEGSITITLDSDLAVYGTHFTTLPAATNNSITFDISENQTGVSFKVLPVNDDIFTDDFVILFSIASVSGVVEKGSNLTYSLIIKNDEQLSIANFATNSGTVSEDDTDGIVVEIPFSRPSYGAAKIKISISAFGIVNYGQDFITEPSGLGGSITLNVVENQSSVSFKVLPIDNSFSNYYKQLQFMLSFFEGGVKGGQVITYDLTIIDNEIAEASLVDTTGTINESSSGITLKINFSKPLPQLTQFVIRERKVNTELYGAVYFTSPAMTKYQYEVCPCDYYIGCYCETVIEQYYALTLDVQQGAMSLELNIKPIDNEVKNDNKVIRFSISVSSDSPTIIADSHYRLTIVDND